MNYSGRADRYTRHAWQRQNIPLYLARMTAAKHTAILGMRNNGKTYRYTRHAWQRQSIPLYTARMTAAKQPYIHTAIRQKSAAYTPLFNKCQRHTHRYLTCQRYTPLFDKLQRHTHRYSTNVSGIHPAIRQKSAAYTHRYSTNANGTRTAI